MEGKIKNNSLLFIAIVLLLTANAFLFFDEPSYDQVRFDRYQFTIADTAAIQRISLISNEIDLTMSRQTNWQINGQSLSDGDIRRMLFTLMNRIRIANKPGKTVASSILSNQDRVMVSFGGIVPDFAVVSNQAKTKTYFICKDEVFEMEVPGYRDFIAAIFQLLPDQWRDRSLISANWRTIQQISVEYPASTVDDFEIIFDQQFFKIAGIDALDSNQVVQYLNEFEALKANEYIGQGRLPQIDSLADTQPELVITIEDINYDRILKFNFFPKLSGTAYQLITNEAGERYILDNRRAKSFYKRQADFVYKPL